MGWSGRDMGRLEPHRSTQCWAEQAPAREARDPIMGVVAVDSGVVSAIRVNAFSDRCCASLVAARLSKRRHTVLEV
jgi:hypothetical protein